MSVLSYAPNLISWANTKENEVAQLEAILVHNKVIK